MKIEMEGRLRKILLEIISKGGLIGSCGAKCLNNEIKAKQFIVECGEQTFHPNAKKLWGERLVQDINEYCHQLKHKALNNFNHTNSVDSLITR